ncbi:MAG: Coenzyme F420 hydrogenase/dehydrogenase, beta subunit C-terminal domain [Candidatus Baldrarchaeia archaeon]
MKVNSKLFKIDLVVRKNLCIGCGTCVGVCPTSALKMEKNKSGSFYVPSFSKERCINCWNCFEVCPVYEFIDERKSDLIRCNEKSFLGNFIKCYIGYSKNLAIRYSSTSGGIATSLLIFALENKIIDGAIVSVMESTNPFEPKGIVAKSKKDILAASGSKYCPVPLNVIIKKILKDGGKYAVVGLPCHIYGLKLSESLISKLKTQIKIHLGLFCSNMPGFKATEYILSLLSYKKEDVLSIEYRGHGWPGYMELKLIDGNRIFIPSDIYWGTGFGQYFSPVGCLLCYDQTNELADISLGDAWIKSIMENDKIGTSLIISRTKVGQDLIDLAVRNNIIEIKEIDGSDVLRSQGDIWGLKKVSLSTRYFILRVLGEKVEISRQPCNFPKPNLIEYLKFVRRILGRRIAARSYLWQFLRVYHNLSCGFINKTMELSKMYSLKRHD